MTHAIIYANRKGYAFFEKTANFPDKYMAEIKRVSERAEASGDKSHSCVRYAPVEDWYLLSVIYREIEGNNDHSRAHVVVVHFLMDRIDANRFFDFETRSFPAAVSQAKATALALREVRDQALPSHMIDNLFAPLERPVKSGDVNKNILLSAAIYCSKSKIQSQYLVESYSEEDTIYSLAALLQSLPHQLRRTVSFHTRIRTGKESIGVAVSFCSDEVLRDIIARDFQGMSQNTNLYYSLSGADREDREGLIYSENLWHTLDNSVFRKYRDAVFSWEELFGMADLNRQNNKLGFLVKSLNEPDHLLEYVSQMELEEVRAVKRNVRNDTRLHDELVLREKELKKGSKASAPAADAAPAESAGLAAGLRQLVPDRKKALLYAVGMVLFYLAIAWVRNTGHELLPTALEGVKELVISIRVLTEDAKDFFSILLGLGLGWCLKGLYDSINLSKEQ